MVCRELGEYRGKCGVLVEKHGHCKSCYIEKYLLKMPSNRIWIDYDEDADVLYISFQKPQHADESEMKDNIIYHYRGKDLVGVTVVGAKKYGECARG